MNISYVLNSSWYYSVLIFINILLTALNKKNLRLEDPILTHFLVVSPRKKKIIFYYNYFPGTFKKIIPTIILVKINITFSMVVII